MQASAPHPRTITAVRLNDPRSLTAFRSVKLLAGGYLGISVLTLVVIALLHSDAGVVNDAVWIRGTIVAASASITFLCALRAAQGSRGAYRRLRILSAVMVVAVVAVIALPGTFPEWMKIEQGVCGIALLGVVAVVNGKHLRALFAA